jgi:exosortase
MNAPPPATATATDPRSTGVLTAVVATLLVLGVAYGPLLWRFGEVLWDRQHYQHFPFVIGAFVWLFWVGFCRARPRATAAGEGSRNRLLGWALLVVGWLLLLAAHFCNSPWFAAVSLTLVIGAAFCRVAREWQFPYLLGVWLLPWLIIPPPMGRDYWFIALLQRVSSGISSRVLDQLGVLHLMEGNTLTLEGKQLFVDQACSGIVSVMSIVAAAGIYGVWRRRPIAQVALLMAIGIGWAVLMNVVRITLIAYVYDRTGADWSEGLTHTWLGLALFSITFGLLVSSEHVVRWALGPVSETLRDTTGKPRGYGTSLAVVWDAVAGWGEPRSPAEAATFEPSPATRFRSLALGVVPLVAFGTLGAGQFALERMLAYEGRPAVAEVLARAKSLADDALPLAVGDATFDKSWSEEREIDDLFGENSRIYRYLDSAGEEYLVSLDFPFPSDVAHDLEVCYSGAGWVRETRRNVEPSTETPRPSEPWRYVELLLTRQGGGKAAVVFCGFDESGDPTWLPGVTFVDSLIEVLQRRRNDAVRRSYQVQVWMPRRGEAERSDEQVKTATELLLAARERFRKLLISGPTVSSEEAPK